MSYCIERDAGDGKPPIWLTGVGDDNKPTWGDLKSAKAFGSQQAAEDFIDNREDLDDCLVMPFDETVFDGAAEKSKKG